MLAPPSVRLLCLHRGRLSLVSQAEATALRKTNLRGWRGWVCLGLLCPLKAPRRENAVPITVHPKQ